VLSGTIFWLILAAWRSILVILHSFQAWVRPVGRSFAGKADGTGDLPNMLNTATPLRWKLGQNSLKISSWSEMYPKAVICVCWMWDSFGVACTF
jgi:hypothetical protein